jgi:DeoR/GlpR family transcriptional regulator of sugar metabolism
VDGISAEAGLTLYYSNEVALARCMIERAELLIVTADGTKVGKHTFAKIAEASEADVLVTNKREDRSEILRLQELGIKVRET